MIGPTYSISNFAWTFYLNSRLRYRYSVACLVTVCHKKRFWISKLALSTFPLTSDCTMAILQCIESSRGTRGFFHR